MKKVLVIGESCRDVFIYCDALRLCPDVPVPVLNIKNETDNPGMAKNVYMNIKSLIDDCDVITNENWYEITKTRYVDEKSNHTFFRVDSQHNISRIDLSKIDYNYENILSYKSDLQFYLIPFQNNLVFWDNNLLKNKIY